LTKCLTNSRGPGRPDKDSKVVTDYIIQYHPFPDFVVYTICIDALNVDPNRPKNKGFAYNDGFLQTNKQHNAEQKTQVHNSFFLVQLTPWDRTFKVAPMHLSSWNSGAASAPIQEVLDEAIRSVISADQRIKIIFTSVDGDEGYKSNFARCFSQIKACLA
jgi:hypothetical protein